MKNIILGAYYNQQLDFQRNVQVQTDIYEYIKPWYESIMKLNLNGVLLTDSACSDEFIEKYQNKNVKIIRRTELGLSDKYNCIINITRFLDYRKFLFDNEFDNVLMTDVSDVTFKKDPFDLIKEDHIAIGMEQSMTGDPVINENNSWARTIFAMPYKNFEFWQKPLLNCGIVGGTYKDIKFLLDKFYEETVTYHDPNNKYAHDMSYFNHLVYTHFLEKIITGMPLHTVFKKYDDDNPDAYIVHK